MSLILTLASRNLFHDRVRLIATVVGIVFSIVLVTVQLGVFLSFERMITTMIDHAQADFWIVPAETKSFEDASLLAGRERLHALSIDRGHGGDPCHRRLRIMAQAKRRRVKVGNSRRRTHDLKWIVPVGCRRRQSRRPLDARLCCDRPVLFDATRRRASRRKSRDQQSKGARRRDDQGHPLVHHDAARFRIARYGASLFGNSAEQGQLFHCARAPHANAAVVRNRLAASMPDVEVLTSEEFRHRSLLFWLFDTGAGAALLGSAILGVIVGTIIVAQTLYSSAKDHLKEFATLRAIGSSRGYILKVILGQALLSAVVGFSMAAAIDFALVRATADAALPIVMTPELALGLFVLTVAMCAIAAVSAIRVVTRTDPVLVFAQ